MLKFLFLFWGVGVMAGPENKISTETLDKALEALAGEETAGRQSGAPGAALARQWLVSWLEDHSVRPAGSEAGSYEQAFDGGINILGILDPAGSKGKEPVVMLGAHYDHTGTNCRAHALAASLTCNGAADNAAGVAAVLAAAETLSSQLKQPIALCFWDMEERGLKGSIFFAKNPSFPTGSLHLYINLDIIGLNLFKGLESSHFALASETGGPALIKDLTAAAADAGLKIRKLSYGFGHNRSDMTSFVVKGYALPIVFFTDGDGGAYHSTADELSLINRDKVARIAQTMVFLSQRAAAGGGAYSYRKPDYSGFFNAMPSDVPVMHDLINAVIDVASDNNLAAQHVADLTTLRDRLEKFRGQDPPELGVPEKQVLLESILGLIKLSKGLSVLP